MMVTLRSLFWNLIKCLKVNARPKSQRSNIRMSHAQERHATASSCADFYYLMHLWYPSIYKELIVSDVTCMLINDVVDIR